jgi:dinuclear metal center YbgI/SA1388 family protein
MAGLKKIKEFLDRELEIDSIEDRSNNGMQVEGKSEVKKIAFSVDACADVFEKAISLGADMIIVHHGISWNDSLKHITDMNYRRVKTLIKNDVSLFAYHLPLDKHATLGNNMQLAKVFKLDSIEGFGDYHGVMIGAKGMLASGMAREEFMKMIDEKLDTKCSILPFGPEKIRSVGIVSGGGGSLLVEAIAEELDCLLIGEGTHELYHEAKEGKMNVIIAGHYETETLGVNALMPLLAEKFGVETVFIDMPVRI